MKRKPSPRIFYGVHLLDPLLAAALDAVRLLSEPGFYRRSHITVRGPYTRALGNKVLASINRQFETSLRKVEITGPASFFLGDQNTVVLLCEIPGIRDVWNKPSYSDGIPHVTLYDGKSRKDATIILHVLKKHRWSIVAPITGIQRLETKIDPYQDFAHVFRQMPEVQSEVLEERTIEDISALPFLDRVIYVERLCRYIEKKFARKPITSASPTNKSP